jgi:hypothetical protein
LHFCLVPFCCFFFFSFWSFVASPEPWSHAPDLTVCGASSSYSYSKLVDVTCVELPCPSTVELLMVCLVATQCGTSGVSPEERRRVSRSFVAGSVPPQPFEPRWSILPRSPLACLSTLATSQDEDLLRAFAPLDRPRKIVTPCVAAVLVPRRAGQISVTHRRDPPRSPTSHSLSRPLHGGQTCRGHADQA